MKKYSIKKLFWHILITFYFVNYVLVASLLILDWKIHYLMSIYKYNSELMFVETIRLLLSHFSSFFPFIFCLSLWVFFQTKLQSRLYIKLEWCQEWVCEKRIKNIIFVVLQMLVFDPFAWLWIWNFAKTTTWTKRKRMQATRQMKTAAHPLRINQ